MTRHTSELDPQIEALENVTRYCLTSPLHRHYSEIMHEWFKQLVEQYGDDSQIVRQLRSVVSAEHPYAFYAKSDDTDSGSQEVGVIKVNLNTKKEFWIFDSGESRVPFFIVSPVDEVTYDIHGTGKDIYGPMKLLLEKQIAVGLVYTPDTI